VGQVNEMTLYPLSFNEFLEAAGQNLLAETMRMLNHTSLKDFPDNTASISSSRDLLAGRLKEYLFIGGMPEAVKTFAESGDLAAVRSVQEIILNNYRNDFSKHISAVNIPKVYMLWDSIPVHLAKEKKKFIYKEVKTGGRASEFENAMNWLTNTGLVYRIDRITNPKIPLSSYGEREHFKLYMLNVGLLSAKAPLDISTFMLGDNPVFTEFKGALTEQFVLQEIKASINSSVFFWGNESGKAEIDFIMQFRNEIVPIEVKSAFNTKSQSLSVYLEKYKPKYAVRLSLKNSGKDGALFSVPLYLAGNIAGLLGSLVPSFP
jgi:predicted AAA+ superfamily ATPase